MQHNALTTLNIYIYMSLAPAHSHENILNAYSFMFNLMNIPDFWSMRQLR